MNEAQYFEQFVGDSENDPPAHYPQHRIEFFVPDGFDVQDAIRQFCQDNPELLRGNAPSVVTRDPRIQVNIK